ncbi:MAG: hypothetical protein IIA45_06535 [Bacteroidetes bacterium]|nr:hypothetical protein [Bacteroidota bacterium]
MKKLILVTALSFLLIQCDKNNVSRDNMSQVSKGLSADEVIEMVGSPDKIIELATVKLNGDKLELWEYGDNQIISMQGGIVLSVILNANENQEMAKELIEHKELAPK